MAAIFRALFGYWFLVFMVRVVGRRPGKQLTPFEFVLIFFIGGVTLTPMVGDDRSITNAFCTIMGIALGHYSIALLRQHWPVFGRIVDGTPLLMHEKGKAHFDTMAKMGIQDDDIMAMARDQGLKRLDEIDYAVLERNGEISIVAKEKN